MTTAIGQRTVRPPRGLDWRTTAAGNIALVVPGAIVVIVIAAQEGRAVIAGGAALLALLFAAALVLPALNVRVRLDQDGMTTFWTRRPGASHVARTGVRRAVLRTIYNGDGITTNRHLFLLDATDRTVYRMNDRWWTDEQLLTVAHHFGVTLESQALPVHLGEVRRTAPGQLCWTERHRVTAVAGTVISVLLLCTAFAALASTAL